jgi:hypothetical protein
MKITWIYASPSGKSKGRDRKNYAASVLTPGLLNNADRSDDLPSVHRLLDGVEVKHRAPARPYTLQ